MRLALTLFLLMLVAAGPALAAMQDYPKIRLRSLDKITARTMTFDARVGTTIKFGSIYIKIQACRKPDIQETPESAAFLQVWEVDTSAQSKWIFSGWMFASSPALSAMDHPIYDVWVIDCLDANNKIPEPAPIEAPQEATDDKGQEKAPPETPPPANDTGTDAMPGMDVEGNVDAGTSHTFTNDSEAPVANPATSAPQNTAQ
jgi:hypothetical protein